MQFYWFNVLLREEINSEVKIPAKIAYQFLVKFKQAKTSKIAETCFLRFYNCFKNTRLVWKTAKKSDNNANNRSLTRSPQNFGYLLHVMKFSSACVKILTSKWLNIITHSWWKLRFSAKNHLIFFRKEEKNFGRILDKNLFLQIYFRVKFRVVLVGN